jgi:hypothetical protein
MKDQTILGMTQLKNENTAPGISMPDRTILRDLAKQLQECAGKPAEEEKRRLWTAHNDLKATRPVIFCDPENGWNEIITDDKILCTGALAQDWEMTLRREICWAVEMKDDKVAEAVFNIPYLAAESDWGMHEQRIGGGGGHAYRWDPPLKDYADIGKLRYPVITVNHAATQANLDLAREVFEPNLEVRLNHKWWWTLGMTWTLVNLRGLDQLMYDMYDEPESVHQVMSILRDGTMARLDFLEKNGLLSSNTGNNYVGSGGFGFTDQLPEPSFQGNSLGSACKDASNSVDKPVLLKDMWGFAESQETIGVSPEMFAEFVFPYQLPLLERFGLNCYGCCEPVDARWKYLKSIPNLRRVSVSAWADVDVMAEALGNQYLFSSKPNPAYLAIPEMDEAYIRKSLRDFIRRTRDNRVEIIMKDNNTLGKNPNNAFNWCRIAKEEALNA